ncbi:MAG: thioester domain-containing protein, partial [Eggerthia catenaformis]|uniref:thioester domain-containing protein n=1 Tax=Eggerthia catenaformis TaxID=31973 RepID=UPI003FA14451
MKQMIKKGFTIFMTVLMTMGMLMNNAFAANDFSKTQLGSKAKYSYGGDEHGTVLYMTKGGEEVYCLEYNKTPANSYSKQDPNFLSQKKKIELGLINYYVHQDYNGKDAYAITQSLVWRYMAGSVKSFIKVKGIARTQSKGSYETYFKQIMTKVKSFNDTPSFNPNTKTIKLGQTAIFKDTKNILKNFTVYSNGGAQVSISGNTLSVKPTTVNKVVVRYKKKVDSSYKKGISLVWTNGSTKQKVGNIKQVEDPIRDAVTVNVLPATGDLHVTKTDITGTREVAGAKLKVTDKDGKTVDE